MRRKGLKSFSAAACTSPKILLAQRTSSCPPPAGSEALSAVLVSIGRYRGRVDPNCLKRPSEAFSDSYYALSIPTISHSALSLYMHS